MKNATLLVAIVFAAMADAKAQQPSAGIVQNGTAKVRAEVSFTPLVHIELGSGADHVALELKSVADYEKGVKQFVKNQLRVFAIGTGYAVMAEARAPKGQEDICKVFALDADSKEEGVRPRLLRPNEKNLVHETSIPKGFEDLHAAYVIKAMDEKNAQAFRDLFGKEGGRKEYNIDVTYTIVAK